MIQNWAAKIECISVLLLTLMLISSFYICIFEDQDFKPLDDNNLKVGELCLELAILLIRLIVIIMYSHLLYKFRCLIKAENEYLQPMKA